MHVAELWICFINVLIKPGPSNLKRSAKGIYVGRHLRSVAQADRSYTSIAHHHGTHVRVISNLDAERFQLTHLRVDEDRL